MTVRVPDTNTYALTDVVAAIEDHAGSITGTLQHCFNNANPLYFDPDYNTDLYAVINSLKRFRNYGPQGIPCGGEVEYDGGVSYPSIVNIVLGSITGNVVFAYNIYNVPDLIIVEWNGSVVLNTNYNGHTSYDYGGANRTAFRNSLTGKIDPINGGTYPNFTNYPDDGYPRVGMYQADVLSFTKNAVTSIATVKVYAPMGGTEWWFRMFCPE